MSRKVDLSGLVAKAETGSNSPVKRIETLSLAMDALRLEEPFKSLFPIREQVKEAIKAHMLEHGYDESKPVDVWKRPGPDGFEYVLVDGFTRALAAQEIGRLTVNAYLHSFATVEEARDYAIHTQRDRRNLSDAEIMSILAVVDQKVTGFKGNASFPSSGGNSNEPIYTARRTAKQIGTSTRKVERARKVHSDPEIAAAVTRGDISINRGYNEILARERAASLESDEETLPSIPSLQASLEGDSKGPEAMDPESIVGRLRARIGMEVALVLDESAESGHLEIPFETRSKLAEIVSAICGPQPAFPNSTP